MLPHNGVVSSLTRLLTLTKFFCSSQPRAFSPNSLWLFPVLLYFLMPPTLPFPICSQQRLCQELRRGIRGRQVPMTSFHQGYKSRFPPITHPQMSYPPACCNRGTGFPLISESNTAPGLCIAFPPCTSHPAFYWLIPVNTEISLRLSPFYTNASLPHAFFQLLSPLPS